MSRPASPLPPAAAEAPPEEDPWGPEEDDLVPPDNFAMVEPGLYRSGFPKRKHFPFLRKLGLRTILTLVLEPYPEANVLFMQESGIRLLQVGMPGNKAPFVELPVPAVRTALEAILDSRNHPMLIHCNKGKHRTGCVVGLLRKVERWGYSAIFNEYVRFAHPKPRVMDQQYIELFDDEAVLQPEEEFLPAWPGLGGR